MEKKYGFRASMSKIERMRKGREVEARIRADERSLWDKVREMGR